MNFRRIVATIWRAGIEGHLPEIRDALRAIREEADTLLGGRSRSSSTGRCARPCRSGALAHLQVACADSRSGRGARPARTGRARQPGEGGAQDALATVVAGLVARHGHLPRNADLLRKLAAILVSNGYGSRRIGELIAPWFDAVVAAEAIYRRVRAQERPVVMNVKGASASARARSAPTSGRWPSGRADWQDFAVITPDVWRKYLLDYDSLGAARRYAGPLTGYEVEIVDEKLDPT